MISQVKLDNRLWRFYLAGSLLVAVLFFGIIELTTRVMSWAGGKGFTLAVHELDPTDAEVNRIYQWHPFTGLTMKPGIKFLGGHPSSEWRAPQFVDRHGFLALDDSLTLEKPKDEIRIATIGASTTASISLVFQDNWPGQLGALVQKVVPGRKVRVINAAVPGFDTAQSVGNLALRVMPFKPDIVIIYHAYNDLKAVQPGKPFAPDYSSLHERPFGMAEQPPSYRRLLHHSMFYVRTRNEYRRLAMVQDAVASLDQTGRLDRVPAPAEEAFRSHIESMIGIARAGGAKVVLSSFATLHDLGLDYSRPETAQNLSPLQRQELASLVHFTPGLTLTGIVDGLNQYNRALHEMATRNRTGWVDNAALVPHDERYFHDRVHFNINGAKRMAENFAPAVIAELKH